MSSIMEAGGRAPWADVEFPPWFCGQIRRQIWLAEQSGEDLKVLDADCRLIASQGSEAAWQRLVDRMALDTAEQMVKMEEMWKLRAKVEG